MKLAKLLSDFLYDKNYFITLFENKIHVYQYKDLVFLSEDKIKLRLENFNLIIEGSNLVVFQMNKEEIIIEGNILKVGKEYE